MSQAVAQHVQARDLEGAVAEQVPLHVLFGCSFVMLLLQTSLRGSFFQRMGSKFELANLPLLRANISNKPILGWSCEARERSFLVLEHNQLAVRMFNDLLCIMGDKMALYPEMYPASHLVALLPTCLILVQVVERALVASFSADNFARRARGASLQPVDQQSKFGIFRARLGLPRKSLPIFIHDDSYALSLSHSHTFSIAYLYLYCLMQVLLNGPVSIDLEAQLDLFIRRNSPSQAKHLFAHYVGSPSFFVFSAASDKCSL
jgi:hypothetical protein